ncbi:MAG: hypothetical protein FJ243_00485 [Nitrospira sp.]|nr:hypothetical protein [Nitrospira sp.]
MAFYGGKDTERTKVYRLFSLLFMHEPTDTEVRDITNLFETKFEDTFSEIRMDFTRLFSENGHLPPYESLYHYSLGEEPRLWGKATKEIQKFFQSVGLMIHEEIDLIPDHLSAGLLFMSHLIENGLMGHQKSFLEKHLLPWIPEYCAEVQKHARTSFYRKIAALLSEMIVSDGEAFKLTD